MYTQASNSICTCLYPHDEFQSQSALIHCFIVLHSSLCAIVGYLTLATLLTSPMDNICAADASMQLLAC